MASTRGMAQLSWRRTEMLMGQWSMDLALSASILARCSAAFTKYGGVYVLDFFGEKK